MKASNYIGRIGGLAVALGVGAAVFTGNGVAWANGDDGSSGASASGSEARTTSSQDVRTKGPSAGPRWNKRSGSSSSSTAASQGSGAGNTSGTTGTTSGTTAGNSTGTEDSSGDDTGGTPTTPGSHSGGSTGSTTPSEPEEGDGTQAEQPDPEQPDPEQPDPEQPNSEQPEEQPNSEQPSTVGDSRSGSGGRHRLADAVDRALSGLTAHRQESSEGPAAAEPESGGSTPTTADKQEEVAAATPSTTIRNLTASAPAGNTAAAASTVTMTHTESHSTETEERPTLLGVVQTFVNRLFHPFAGYTPNTLPSEFPAGWVMLAAARREMFGDTATSASPASVPGSTTLVKDGKTYTVVPSGPEVMTGIYNQSTAGPAVNESVQGYQKFDVYDGDTVTGSFYAYVSTASYRTPYLFGSKDKSSQVLYVDSSIGKLFGDEPSTAFLPDGSVISTYSIGTLRNVYQAIPGNDPNSGSDDVVNDYLTDTRSGKVTDLTALIRGLGFNAAYVPPILPTYIRGVGNPVATSISALPPITIGVQGYQTFEHLDANGQPDGQFYAVITTTEDTIGFKTQALLVTGYPEGQQGNSPAVGTVFNTVKYGDLLIVYRSEPQATGPAKVTVTIQNVKTPDATPLDVSWLYQDSNASQGLTDGTNVYPFTFAKGYTVTPTAGEQELFTGVNGLPPVSATVSSNQVFTVTKDGQELGTFTAVVTTTPKMLLTSKSQALLVTASNVADVPVGSVFDVYTTSSGAQRIYTDLVGKGTDGTNKVTLIQVNRNGSISDLSWTVRGKDASAGLDPDRGDVIFDNEPWLNLFYPLANRAAPNLLV